MTGECRESRFQKPNSTMDGKVGDDFLYARRPGPRMSDQETPLLADT